jgi:DNA repair protein RecN (Recombination protein N)
MPKAQLVELYAHGLGVIEDARLELGPGFNVITGETGAGKTLLLGALELCLGAETASSRYAAHSDMRAAAVFLQGAGDEVVLTRETSSTGRLRSTLNAIPSSAEVLRTLAHELVVIHGQHDSLALRNRSEVLRIIDASASISTTELDVVRHSLREAFVLRDSFGGDQGARDRELDFLEFQISEIIATKIISKDELFEALESLTRLSTLRDGQEALATVIDELDADRDDAVLSRLARCIERIPGGEAYDGARESLLRAVALAREGLHELGALSDPDVFDPVVMGELDERVAVLQQVARKYGGTLESVLVTLDDLRTRLDLRRGDVERLANLDVEIAALEAQERVLARKARREREFAAVTLTEAVCRQLPRVALPDALLRFEVDGDDGSHAQILFRPNPGLAEGPLQALASGGELSRVLLALSLETAHEDVVAVFDEIDAGVGGQVAQQIGQCLSEVGHQQQVLAVTHLASVAAQADHHFVIEKTTVHGVTSTSVRVVTATERVNEIARMLAGDAITDEAKALALQLLESSGK